jgi:hypothetical protein
MTENDRKVVEKFFGTQFQVWESADGEVMSLHFQVKDSACHLLVDNKNDTVQLEIDSIDKPTASYPIAEIFCHFNKIELGQLDNGWPILKIYHTERVKDVPFIWITKLEEGYFSFSVFPNAET